MINIVKKGYILLIILVILALGPKPPKPKLLNTLPNLSLNIGDVESFVKVREQKIQIKPNNNSMIVWADEDNKQQTEWCLLYLHGFSASPIEGMPTHVNFAKYFGMNFYSPLLATHGLDTSEPLLNMTPDTLYNSAKEALTIARTLGKKVIVMSTSTGGTLSLKLAADFPELVDAQILYSPNVRINSFGVKVITKPWGLYLARLLYNGKYRTPTSDENDYDNLYWYCKYRLEGVVYLQQLVDETMHKGTFSKVKAPTFLAYYYTDNEHQDKIIKVDAALKMFDEISTPSELKQCKAFNAGVHTIANGKVSNTQAEVELSSINFAIEVLGIKAVQQINQNQLNQ